MARVLIVGCGCRGRSLARALVESGHVVRGTTRDPARMAQIAAAGAEPVVVDPDRLGTLMAQLRGVSALCWLMGSATGTSAAALHGARLRALLERLVDTPVRGVVYEAAGRAPADLLAGGSAAVRDAGARWRMPFELVEADPADHGPWRAAMAAAVARVL